MVGEACEAFENKLFWSRPVNGRGCPAFRELPVNGGGEAVVAGLLPISVPLWSHREVKGDPEGLAGFDGIHLRYEFCFNCLVISLL